MKIYDFEFIGREKNALGITYRIQASRMAGSEDDARLALYDAYEHVIVNSVTVRELERPIGHTLRNGNNRASYRPDWSLSQPWAAYTNGTAGRHFATERQAVAWLNA